MELTQEQKLYAEIVEKAWEDPQFKTDLMANPVEAIKKATGQKFNVPAGKKLVVRDKTDDTVVQDDTIFYLNIPSKSDMEDVELNEEQLEVVAGGDIGMDIAIWIIKHW